MYDLPDLLAPIAEWESFLADMRAIVAHDPTDEPANRNIAIAVANLQGRDTQAPAVYMSVPMGDLPQV